MMTARDATKNLLGVYLLHRRTFESKIAEGFHFVFRVRTITTDAVEAMERRL